MNVRNLSCLTAAGFLGALMITAAASPARAKQSRPLIVQAERPDREALTARVTYYIADLRSERGQKDLVRRVRTATQEVCPESATVDILDSWRKNCLRVAWNGARPQIEAAIDTAMNSKVAGAVPMTVTIGLVAAH